MDPGSAEEHAFFDVRDSEPAGSFVFQHTGDFECSVAIGIGFHNGHNVDAATDMGADGTVIAADAAEGYF
jgi:hypothetical protein